MEFIPLEKDSKRTKNKKKPLIAKSKKNLKVDETIKDENAKNAKKAKPNPKVKIQKKNVKNKYKETLALKQSNKISNKKNMKKKDDTKDTDEKMEVNPRENLENKDKKAVKKNETTEDENKRDEGVDENDEDNEVEDDDDDDDLKKEKEAFERKCKEMDEKKKNRLFIKLKKKIYSDAQIKELHPNIRSVIFPRKKNPRWCWAVFASEEKANETMKQLSKNKEILISKPNAYEMVDKKRKEKMKTVLRKKEMKKKFKKIWM